MKVTREAIEPIIKENWGILTRTAEKVGKSVSYVRQVIVLQERDSEEIWNAFGQIRKEMGREQATKRERSAATKKRALQAA